MFIGDYVIGEDWRPLCVIGVDPSKTSDGIIPGAVLIIQAAALNVTLAWAFNADRLRGQYESNQTVLGTAAL